MCTATLAGDEKSKTAHGWYLGRRRDWDLDRTAFAERQKGTAVPSGASSSCSFVIMKMATVIIAVKGPIAGYRMQTPIEPAGEIFHRDGQESLNHRESQNGESRILPSAQTVLCLLCWRRFIFKNLCHLWVQKHIIFIQCFVFELNNTQIKQIKSTIYLPSNWYWPVGSTFRNNVVLSGATMSVCLAAAVAFDSENHQMANARFELWANVLQITPVLPKTQGFEPITERLTEKASFWH